MEKRAIEIGQDADRSNETDRRDSSRTIALFRPALIEGPNFRSFCLVRNISPTGLMANYHARLQDGELVTARFSETNHVDGRIAWQRDDRVGIEFSKAVELSSLLSGASQNQQDKNRYRAPRLSIRTSARFIVHESTRSLEVRDISQRGLKAVANSVSTDEEGTLVIPGLEPRGAVVRWVRNGLAGFYFLEPIAFAELGQWVLQQHERNSASD